MKDSIQFTYSAVHSLEAIRDIDSAALADGHPLMKRAAQAAIDCLKSKDLWRNRLLFIVGSGNNGGDALLMAKIAHNYGAMCHVLLAKGFTEKMSEQTQTAYESCIATSIVFEELTITHLDQCLAKKPTVVDGLIGSGLKGVLNEYKQLMINTVNQSGLPVLALDIPSGLNACTGMAQPTAVRASCTITFVSQKLGLFTADGVDYAGSVVFDDLGTARYAEQWVPQIKLIRSCRVPERKRNMHKNRIGSLTVIGGCHGMQGAVVLATTAALRVAGVGVCYAVVQTPPVGGWLSEVIIKHEANTLITPVLVGPGLGLESWGKQQFSQAIHSSQPKVIDADALTLLANNPTSEPLVGCVLTPHPGEAACLLNCSTVQIQADRFSAVKQIQKRYGGVVVLKGAGTLIADENQCYLIDFANGDLSVAGMGDTLAGIIAGYLAQGFSAIESALVGAHSHAVLAKAVQKIAAVGSLPSDLTREPFRRLMADD